MSRYRTVTAVLRHHRSSENQFWIEGNICSNLGYGGGMGADLQGSLLDAFEDPALGSLDGLARTELGRGAWIDVLPGWLTGADQVYARLAGDGAGDGGGGPA